MNTLILFQSQHHGNTKKLVDAIAAEYPVEICDARTFDGDLSKYDAVGFASGIAFGKFYPEIFSLATDRMPFEKDIFFIFTAGVIVGDPVKEMRELALERGCRVHGTYCCRGYDTFGPLKLIGGLNRGCPTDDEIRGAVDYYRLVLLECGDTGQEED